MDEPSSNKMSRRHYRIDQKPDNRKIRFEILIAAVLLIAIVVGGTYIFFDLNRSDVVIDNSGNRAILGTVESDEFYKRVDNEYYQMKIPTDWKKINNPEVIVNGTKYYPERYQGVEGEHVGRRLDVYREEIPYQLGIDKVVKVSAVGSEIVTVKTSPQCYKFTDFPYVESGDDHPSEWEGIPFMCMSSQITNVLGAIEFTQRDGVVLDSPNYGTQKYFLVYMDHGSRLDNSIFYNILESFRVK